MLDSNSEQHEKNRGQVGVGLLIVFIAIVIVAAIAASVIVFVGGESEETAQNAGVDSIQETSDRLQIENEFGVTGDGSTGATPTPPNNSTVAQVNLHVGISPGAEDVDLSKAQVTFVSDTENVLNFDTSADPGNDFTVVPLAGGVDATRPILQDSEDLAEIQIQLNDSVDSQFLLPEEEFEVVLRTESGAAIQKTLEVPSLLDANEPEELVKLE